MRIQRNDNWGTSVQLGATVLELEDLRGNNDGLWRNETKPAGQPRKIRGTLGATASAVVAGAGAAAANKRLLETFRERAEKAWGRPVMDPTIKEMLRDGELFAVQKAIALARLRRTPDTVVDAFVKAAGTVNGETIERREIFVQHFVATAKPSKCAIVVGPGYLETGRNFYDQVALWNAAGHDVFVYDQQWAGQSTGTPGQVDRGFGIARDMAAVAAHAWQKIHALYGDEAKLGLYGNSMGGGAGAVGAWVLQHNGLIQLDGPQMPSGAVVVAQAPFFGATPGVKNGVLQLIGKIPVLNRVQLPMIEGLPDLTSDPIATQRASQGGVLEAVAGQSLAYGAVKDDLAFIRGLIDAGKVPKTKAAIVHAVGDTVAHYELAAQVASGLGAELITVPGKDHVLEQSPKQQGFAVDAMNRALATVR